MEGQFKMEMAKGKLDEVTMTYAGNKPLVFAGAHSRKIEYERIDLYFFIIWEFGPVFLTSSTPPNCS